MGRSQWPIRIPQELPCDKDRVRLSGSDDLLCLNWRSDHPHRTRHDFSFPTNPLSKRRLVPGADRNFCMRHAAARRTIDQIHSYLPQSPGKLNRLFDIPAAIDPIGGRNAHEERRSLGPRGSNRSNNLTT
ncbi:MAG: hypothetical protein QOF72_2535 [Blastocatellia bacterium]|nr:hypothetical protein [Blastocatellia bacterium]